jgi:hypothetical protein
VNLISVLTDFYAQLDNQAKTALVLVGCGLLVSGLFRITGRTPPRAQAKDERSIKRPTNTHVLRRAWWGLFPPHDLMRVDGLVIDRSRKPHCAWLGPTGAGKSASVATVRVDGARPTLCVMPDLSDPLRAAAERQGQRNGRCFIWTACEGWPQQPVNFLIGEPTEVAERLTEVFRSGGVGAWKRAARLATGQVIRDIDANGEPRTLELIGVRLAAAVKADRELRTVCAGWVARFLDLADQFGDSIGPDGVDLSELLRGGFTIVLDNDAFDHPSLGGDVVALGLAEAKRCASLVPGGFRLIFEEAGQLGDRIDLAEPFHRAGRRRKIAVDDLTQAESDLPEGISANIATRVYFAQELQSLQKTAADRLGLKHVDLDPAAMKDFTAYVAHGRIRRLVKFPKPAKAPKESYRDGGATSVEFGRDDAVGDESSAAGRYVVAEIFTPEPVRRLALPPPGVMFKKYEEKTYRDGGCLRWRGRHDNDGYGYIWDEWEEKSVGVHRWRWEQAYGPIGRDPETGKKLTVNHRRTCYKDCSDILHLDILTRGDNVRMSHQEAGLPGNRIKRTKRAG